MEEKLRNLSQNIAANTSDEYKHEEPPRPEDEAPEENESEEPSHHDDVVETPDSGEEENHEEYHEESNDEVSDYNPESEEHFDEPEEEFHDEPVEENHEEEPVEEAPAEEPSEEPVEEAPAEEEPAPAEEEPKILTMSEEGQPEEPETEKKKYSPEVEAALNRLKSDEVAVNFDTEPLSTEPKKVNHGGRILLFFLFVIAIVAVVLCILVEQKVISNPLDLFSGKKEEPAKVVESDDKESELTDPALVKSIDALFAALHEDENYYIYSRMYQKLKGVEYVYYDVAEPATKVESPTLSGELTETVDSTKTDCVNSAETDCLTATDKTVSAENYKKFPHYRYIFVKNSSNTYEFHEKHLLDTPSAD